MSVLRYFIIIGILAVGVYTFSRTPPQLKHLPLNLQK